MRATKFSHEHMCAFLKFVGKKFRHLFFFTKSGIFGVSLPFWLVFGQILPRSSSSSSSSSAASRSRSDQSLPSDSSDSNSPKSSSSDMSSLEKSSSLSSSSPDPEPEMIYRFKIDRSEIIDLKLIDLKI